MISKLDHFPTREVDYYHTLSCALNDLKLDLLPEFFFCVSFSIQCN